MSVQDEREWVESCLSLRSNCLEGTSIHFNAGKVLSGIKVEQTSISCSLYSKSTTPFGLPSRL